ncbi:MULTISPECIES: thiol-disulfide oxidoreductase DCC family protein [Marinobacter]|uniref:thiol-disulfide oxidoreductase DCC family protein n=1 Tax=Marinobacter TaxID=2742 RepID=UPI000DAC741D|nr:MULTISPECIES: DCC1-like thiol-disulfide oxidoreductase family protein [Marinobacter]
MTDEPVILFDGVCALCQFWARFVVRHDHSGRFRLGTLQSSAGQALCHRTGVDPQRMDSVVLIQDGDAHLRSDAILRIVSRLPRPWCWLRGLRWVPRPLRDAVYDIVGRFRYRVFGRYDQCPLPAEADRWRFID